MVFNTDTMYLPSIYNDVVVEGNSLAGWNFTASLYFFPDVILFFIIASFTSNIIWQIILFAIIQYIINVLIINRIFFFLVDDGNKANLLTLGSNLLISLVFLPNVFYYYHEFTYYMVSNAFHLGVLTMTLLGCWFFLGYYKTKKNKYLYLLLSLVFIGCFSDKLYLVSYVVPLILVLLFNFLITRNLLNLLLIGGLLLSSKLGFYAYNKVRLSEYFEVVLPPDEFAFDRIGSSFDKFWEQITVYYADSLFSKMIYFITIAVIIVFGICAIRGVLKKQRSLSIYSKMYVAISVVIILSAPIINGSYPGFDSIRYNYHGYIIALLAFPLIINERILALFTRFLFVFVFGVGLYITLTGKAFKNWEELSNYYPKKSQSIDYFANKYDLKDGVCFSFWDSKISTLFNKEKIDLRHIFWNTRPYHHASNENWYYGKDQVFNFFIYKTQEELDSIKSVLHLTEEDIIIDHRDPFNICVTPDFYYQKRFDAPTLK